MPSILNTPANEIPIHFFRLPVAQREVLLVNVLTDPILYESIIASPYYRDDPTFQQAIVLFRNYTLIRQLFARLAVLRLPIQIAEAFDPALSATRTSVLVLLVDRGLDRLLGTLPRDHLASILRTVILSLSEGQRRAYYHPNDTVEGTVQEEENHRPPPPLVEPRSPRPARASSPTDSLSSTDTAVNPLPQLARRTTPFPPRRSNPLSPRERYRRDATPAQRGRPRVDRRGTPAMGSGRVTLPGGLEVVVGAGTRPPLPHPLWYGASSANLPSTSAPSAPSTCVPSVEWPPQDIPSALALCAPPPSVENSVMWAPVAQPQPQLVHPLPEWLTEEIFESGSRRNEGGNVTVEDPPIPFSPFSLADCTMLNHFSFDDFIAIAFPDIAGDLDAQI